MIKSQHFKEAIKHLLLISINIFCFFTGFVGILGALIGFWLVKISGNDNIFLIGLYTFPLLVLIISSALLLKYVKPWLFSIPVQLIAYGAFGYFSYGPEKIIQLAMLVGGVIAIQAVIIGIKLLARMLITYKKKRIQTSD